MRGGRRKKRQLLEKETTDLVAARERFYKRAVNLFEKDGTPKHSQEEIGRRLAEYQDQFEITARKLERRADNMETAARRVLGNRPPEARKNDREAQRAEIRLEACEVLRKGVRDVRGEVAKVAAGDPPRGEK